MFQFPKNAIILFFKATQMDLFGAMTPVKGYINKKTGKPVASYTGLRHKKISHPSNLFGHAVDAAAPSHIQPEAVYLNAQHAPRQNNGGHGGGGGKGNDGKGNGGDDDGKGGSGDKSPRRFKVTAERKGKEVKFTVEDAFFDWLQVKPHAIWADVDRLHLKHPDHFASVEDVQQHIQDVLAGAEIAMPATHVEYTLLVALRDHEDHQAATIEFVLRGGKYRVRNAQKMPQTQLDVKLDKAGDGVRLRRGKRNPTVPPRNPTTPGISAGSPVPPSDGPPTKPQFTLPPPAPEGNTAPAGEQDVQRQMAAVRQRYQGTAQWLKAPNGQPTKLKERQWLQVRTPAFKQWFGDWEYAAHQQAIDKLPTVPVDFELDNAQSLAEARHQALAEAKRRFALDQNPKKVITPNGDGIWIAMSGLKESISKHAGPQKMRILPILDRLIENSHFVLAAPDAKTEQRKTPNILGYRYYVAKAKLGEKAYYVKLAVREVEDRGVKRKFYDHDLSEVSEVTREQGTAHLAAAGNPTAMTSLDHIVHQGWQKFNEEASKVIDENGEPLVVYHGTDADFSQFNISHFGKNDSGWYGKGFYFTPDKDWTFAEDSAERNGGAPNVMPVYLNVKKPVYGYANAEQGSNLVGSAAERGMDGVIVRYDPGHSQEYEIAEIVVTRPTQIKSALGNRGTFDGNEGDITKSFHPTRRALFLKAGFRGIAT